MNPAWVLVVYGSSLVLALALLYFFRARWYWHVLSVGLALTVGLVRLPEAWNLPDLAIGFVFFFLLVWGAAAPLVPSHAR